MRENLFFYQNQRLSSVGKFTKRLLDSTGRSLARGTVQIPSYHGLIKERLVSTLRLLELYECATP